METNKSSRVSSTTLLAAVAALVLEAASPGLARNAPARGVEASLPAREGNVYDHHDHQPTQAEVDSAAAAAGIRAPSPESKTQVENEIEGLLRQTDELDRESNEDLKSSSSGRH